MAHAIKNVAKLKNLLWADFFLGATTGILGLSFVEFFVPFFGLTKQVLIGISAVTLIYSIFALFLALKNMTPIQALRILIFANWGWTIISAGIIAFHFMSATLLGQAFLILQIIVVGVLAWLEGNQLVKK